LKGIEQELDHIIQVKLSNITTEASSAEEASRSKSQIGQ
jgi:hypothetical protein